MRTGVDQGRGVTPIHRKRTQCQATSHRGAPRLRRGAPNVGGFWGAISGPPMRLVQAASQGMQRLGGALVLGGGADGGLELPQRLPPFALFEVDPSEVHVRELPWLVPLGQLGPLQPRHRLIQPVLLHQVDADVVVRVAEVGIDVDRQVALARRLVEPPLEGIGPAQERVGLGGGTDADRFLVERDGAIELARHLVTVRLPPEIDGPAQVLGQRRRHGELLRARAHGCPPPGAGVGSTGAMWPMSGSSCSVSAIFVYEENIWVTPTTSMMPPSPTPSRRISPRWNAVPNAERVVSDTANASEVLRRRLSWLSVNARLAAAHRSPR